MSGFEEANYTQTPNAFFDKLLSKIDSMSELKVTLAVIRNTMGFHRREHEMSLSYLQEATGLSRESVSDGIQRALKRGTVVRKPSGQTYVYSLKVVGKADQSSQTASRESRPVTSRDTRPKKESKERKNKDSLRSSLVEGESNESPPPPKTPKRGIKPKGISSGRYGVSRLMDFKKEASEQGAQFPPLTNRQRGEYGEFFSQAISEGDSVEDAEMALRYLIAKAAGDVPHEPAAWAYYGTAQTAIREGWRPKTLLKVVGGTDADGAEWDEILKLQDDLIKEATSG